MLRADIPEKTQRPPHNAALARVRAVFLRAPDRTSWAPSTICPAHGQANVKTRDNRGGQREKRLLRARWLDQERANGVGCEHRAVGKSGAPERPVRM